MTPIARQIKELKDKNFAELKEIWLDLCQDEPPPLRHGFMRKALAHRIQELALEGLSDEARNRLDRIIEETSGKKERKRKRTIIPVPGARLVREWHGKRHEVIVLRKGFEFDGRQWGSLTAIAQKITGAHWNGPAFFGLRKEESEKIA